MSTMARTSEKSPKVAKKAAATKPALLSGGNPQIAKADGDAPVQAYIAAMPGWKRDVGRRLDALIVRTVPGVRKTVKWNSPFYGVGSGVVPRHPLFCEVRQSSFLSGHFAASYPARRVQAKEVRYPDIHEDDQLDEAQVAAWVKEASQLPGKQM